MLTYRRFSHQPVLAATAVLLAFAGVAKAEVTYSQNFDGFADGTTNLGDGTMMFGTAKVVGGALQLTQDGGPGGGASFSIPPLAEASSGWRATFDLSIFDSSGNELPADGMSFNWGSAPGDNLGAAEEGMTGSGVANNISFEIDTWNNGEGEQGVNISNIVNGGDQNLVFTGGPILNDGTTVSGQVTISWDPVNGASFTTTGLLTNADFENVATSLVGDDAFTFIFSGRVGGANETKTIDNLVIITNPDLDTDNDGLPDNWEERYGLATNDDGSVDPDNGPDGDPDEDGVTNKDEYANSTNPIDFDTDDDGLSDGVENNTGTWAGAAATGTDPLDPDSDDDGLNDGVENNTGTWVSAEATGTDPHNCDSDGDTTRDGLEVSNGSDPTIPNAALTEYSQDFDIFTNGTKDLGDGTIMSGTANVQGGALELTRDGIGGGFASFSVPGIVNSSLGWKATFDLTITDSAGALAPADGMSFNYGNAPLGERGSAEEGMAGVGAVTENISFEIDTWNNGNAELGVNIAEKTDGADRDLAFSGGSILNDGTSVSGPVEIIWNPTDGASFTTSGLLTNAIFSNVATSFTPCDGHTFIISARVGSANETLLIDNLVIISTGTVATPLEFTDIQVDVTADPITVSLTWASRLNRIYKVERSTGMTAEGTPGGWIEVDDSVISLGDSTTFTDFLPTGNGKMFWRVTDVGST